MRGFLRTPGIARRVGGPPGRPKGPPEDRLCRAEQRLIPTVILYGGWYERAASVQWSGPRIRRALHNTTTPMDAAITSQKVNGVDPRSILPVRPIAMTPVFNAPTIARTTSAVAPLASSVTNKRFKLPLPSGYAETLPEHRAPAVTPPANAPRTASCRT